MPTSTSRSRTRRRPSPARPARGHDFRVTRIRRRQRWPRGVYVVTDQPEERTAVRSAVARRALQRRQLEQHARTLAGRARDRIGRPSPRSLARPARRQRGACSRRPTRSSREALKDGRQHHAGGRVVRRQLPPHRGADPHRPAHLPAGTTASCRGWQRLVAGAPARLRHRDRADLARRMGASTARALRRSSPPISRVTPLRLGELWAIPIMLRLALAREPAPRGRPRVTAGRRDRELAGRWVEKLSMIAAKRAGATSCSCSRSGRERSRR